MTTVTNSILSEVFVLLLAGASLAGLIPLASLVFAALPGTSLPQPDVNEDSRPDFDVVPGRD